MKKLTAKKVAKIKALHKKGMSERAIAKEVRCSRSAVWYHVHEV